MSYFLHKYNNAQKFNTLGLHRTIFLLDTATIHTFTYKRAISSMMLAIKDVLILKYNIRTLI